MSQLQPNHLIMQQLHTLTHLPPLPVLCYLFPLSSYSAICYFSLPTLLSVPSLFLLCYLFLISSYSANCSLSLPTVLTVPSLFLLCYVFLLSSFSAICSFSLPTLLSVPSLFLLCYMYVPTLFLLCYVFLLSSYSAICSSFSLSTLLSISSYLLILLFVLFSSFFHQPPSLPSGFPDILSSIVSYCSFELLGSASSLQYSIFSSLIFHFLLSFLELFLPSFSSNQHQPKILLFGIVSFLSVFFPSSFHLRPPRIGFLSLPPSALPQLRAD